MDPKGKIYNEAQVLSPVFRGGGKDVGGAREAG